MAVLELLDSPKLISRKICLTEKSWNVHTLCKMWNHFTNTLSRLDWLNVMFSLYRNVHCAICNKASLEKLICLNLGPFGRFNWQQNFNSFSFAVLFDISGNGKDHVGFVSCQSGELYDPFYKKCRNVRCGQEGMCL